MVKTNTQPRGQYEYEKKRFENRASVPPMLRNNISRAVTLVSDDHPHGGTIQRSDRNLIFEVGKCAS